MTEQVTEPSGVTALPGTTHQFSRRVLLRTGTLGAAAAGIATAIPGLSGFLTSTSTVAPEVSGVASEGSAVAGETAAMDGPIVAHITDAGAGQVSIYVGEREVLLRDQTLVQHLLRAAR